MRLFWVLSGHITYDIKVTCSFPPKVTPEDNISVLPYKPYLFCGLKFPKVLSKYNKCVSALMDLGDPHRFPFLMEGAGYALFIFLP